MNQNATYSATNVIKSATCLQNIKKTIWYNRTKEQDLRLENSDYTVTSRRSITTVASTSQQYYQRQQDISASQRNNYSRRSGSGIHKVNKSTDQ